MGAFSRFLQKFPFIGKKSGGNGHGNSANNVEMQYNKAMELIDHGISFEAVNALDKVADVGVMESEYKEYGCDALKILGELFETGKYKNIKVKPDAERAVNYYERYIKLREEASVYYKIGKLMLDLQNFTRAIACLQKAADAGIKPAYMVMGNIYEHGLNKVDEYGNKSDFIVPVDFDKAKEWYHKLEELGDPGAKAALERIVYKEEHGDSIQFVEKDKLYTQIAEKRKAKGIVPRFKIIEGSKLQYQYVYIHNQVEGFIHKLPKDWVKTMNPDTEEEYYAPSHTYKDFAVYISYVSVPKDSKRTLESYLRYMNEAIDDEMNITEYITEYADGICATFYHKEMEKGIVTFAFGQMNRMACIRCVCANMDIIEQYEEIIFEIANSFAFVNPTLASDTSANRKDQQYYNEAVYYYYMEEYELAMENARRALKNGSVKASYLLIELYFDEDSPYKDLNKAISYATELFNVNKDSDLAFLLGNIYDQHLKEYETAKEWYEKADKLGHKRASFYLGRLYYYGVLKTKRDGMVALDYFKKAVSNGIFEAEPYAKDIENLGAVDLQESVDHWELEVQKGNPEIALQVAMMKKDQVFFVANEYSIETAFKLALDLGAVQAAYELGMLYRRKEADPSYTGEKKSIEYFVMAFEKGYEDFDREILYQVVEYMVAKGMSDADKLELYLRVAYKGYGPAVDKVIALGMPLNEEVRELYEDLRIKAMEGDESSLISMNKLEHKYPELILHPAKDGEKIIKNKFFQLTVPKVCTAVIEDEGGTIKFADSIVEFAVAEMPVDTEHEEDYLKVYKLIIDEYSSDETAEIILANSRMVGAAMTNTKAGQHNFSILLISSKNQYLFKMTSKDRRELISFKQQVINVAKSLVESGETYIATGDKAKRNIGLSFLITAGEGGRLSLSKED